MSLHLEEAERLDACARTLLLYASTLPGHPGATPTAASTLRGYADELRGMTNPPTALVDALDAVADTAERVNAEGDPDPRETARAVTELVDRLEPEATRRRMAAVTTTARGA